MKKIIYLFVAILGITSASAQTTGPIEFAETAHSFGKIKQGIPASFAFTFKNTSDKPVIIESAVAGCGCTTPEFPKGAISPGSSEKIKVTYNAASTGTFTKQVTVKLANVQDPIVLTINGEVADASAGIVAKPAVSDKVSTTSAKPSMKAAPAKAKVKSKS